MISQNISHFLTSAQTRALATNGPSGLNVVPVSMLKVNEEAIWLFDFFMNKTVSNVQAEPQVAFTAWTEMTGVQIKGDAKYITDGDSFHEAVAWVATQNPARVVKGLIVFTPKQIFDVSPGGAFAQEDLVL